jgi:hypothetical protein
MPKPPTKLAEVMITTYYGKRPLRWIADQLGCSAPTVLAYAERLGLSKPTPGKQRGRKPLVPVPERIILPIAPTAGFSHANHPCIPPPTREQLMAGSANPRRVYKVEG